MGNVSNQVQSGGAVKISRDALVGWIRALAKAIEADEKHLTELDAAIGDADHGANMHRGFQAVLSKLPALADKDIAAILRSVGMTLVSTVGGAGGPLYGTLFIQMAAAASDKTELSVEDWAVTMRAGVQGVIARGKAAPGEKTMVDTLIPAVAALERAAGERATLAEALARAADAGKEGMMATIPMVARKGRASYLGERSAVHQDPGATSAFLLLQTAAETLAGAGE